MRVSNGIACLQLFKSDSCIEMQLPAWIHSGKEVWYVYMEGDQRMMEVYNVDADRFELVRTGVCSHMLGDYRKLPKVLSQWLDKKRVVNGLGQPKLY